MGFLARGLDRSESEVSDADQLNGKTEVNLGELDKRKQRRVSSAFRLQNIGAKPLRIVKSAASCLCTNVTVQKDEIQPGNWTDIMVEIDLSSVRGKRDVFLRLLGSKGQTDYCACQVWDGLF